MRILNCLKITPDPDQVPESEWLSGAGTGVFDFSYLKKEIDSFSESGLELTLRMAEEASRAGKEVHLSALTAGPAASDKALRTLLALGFDACIRIDDEPDIFRPEHTAAMIAGCIRQSEPFDCIVFGEESPDGKNRKTPLLVAEHLGMPLVGGVIQYTLIDEKSIRVRHEVTGGICEETLPVPVVLVVGNVPETLLRVPTLMQRRAAAGREITVIDGETIRDALSRRQVHIPEVRLEALRFVDQSRAGQLVEESDPARIAQILYENYIREVRR